MMTCSLAWGSFTNHAVQDPLASVLPHVCQLHIQHALLKQWPMTRTFASNWCQAIHNAFGVKNSIAACRRLAHSKQ